MISAVLDSCVLYSSPLRSFLLWLAEGGLFRPHWSKDIHEEWMRNLYANRPDLLWERLERTRRKMDSEFPNSIVRGYEAIMPTLQLPDPNDTHVLAVAIQANAQYIVTFNLNDFPKSVLQTYGVVALSPEAFALRLIDHAPYPVLRAVRKHRLSLKQPPKTVDEYLVTLEQQRLPKIVAFLRQHKDII